MKNTALVVAGLIFLLLAVMHAIRYYLAWNIVIVNLVIPMHVSIVGFIVSIVLSIWMFVAAAKK